MSNDAAIPQRLTIFKINQPGAPQPFTEPPRPPAPLAPDYVVDPSCDLRGVEKMRIGKGVVIQKDCWINIAFNNPNSQFIIEIGEGTNIGRRCTLSGANKISLGKNVLLGPNVFIADTSHEYQHVAVPISQQDLTTHTDEVHIGDETWIGTNCVIAGNVRIGKHCVIGANTIVNKDVPDYCVVVGNPFRIVKLFDPASGTWVKVSSPEEAQHYLQNRPSYWLEHLLPLTQLHSLQVEVSSVCNLNCPQCFQHIPGHKKGVFTRELWDQKIHPVLGQLRDIHLVGIGEPLLCKNFFYFVADALQHQLQVHTTSNLQLLTPELAEQIVTSGLQELSFSCDGIRPETYAAIRVHGKLETLENSLNLINIAKLRHQTPFPRLVLNFGGMRSNIQELPEVVAFAHAHQVDLIIAYHNVMYVPELKEESLFHDQALSDQKFLEAKRAADQLGVKMFLPGLFSQPLRYQARGCYCTYPSSHLYVYSDGRVGPCCMDFPDRYVLGDLRQSTVEAIWNQAAILKLRHELTTQPSETCRYCVSHGKMDISDPRYFFRFPGSDAYIQSLHPAKTLSAV